MDDNIPEKLICPQCGGAGEKWPVQIHIHKNGRMVCNMERVICKECKGKGWIRDELQDEPVSS